MNNHTQAPLYEWITQVLIQLWLYKQLNECTLLAKDIKAPPEILQALSDKAVGALETIDEDDVKLERILIDLCEVHHMDASQAEQVLQQIRSTLNSVHREVADQDKLNAVASLVPTFVHEIRSRPTFEQAKDVLACLDRLIVIAARLAFAGSATLSESMIRIINDFEHAFDDEITLRAIYQDIRSGNYFGL